MLHSPLVTNIFTMTKRSYRRLDITTGIPSRDCRKPITNDWMIVGNKPAYTISSSFLFIWGKCQRHLKPTWPSLAPNSNHSRTWTSSLSQQSSSFSIVPYFAYHNQVLITKMSGQNWGSCTGIKACPKVSTYMAAEKILYDNCFLSNSSLLKVE